MATFTVTASDYIEGENISEELTGVTLSADGNAVSPFDDTVVVTESATVSTDLRIGYNNLAVSSPSIVGGSSNADLTGLFDSATNAEVSVTFIGNGDTQTYGSTGHLRAFDSTDTLLDTATTADLAVGVTETITVTGTNVSYFIADQFIATPDSGSGSIEITEISYADTAATQGGNNLFFAGGI